FFSSRRRHTRWPRDWSSDVCSSDLFALMLDAQGRSHPTNLLIVRDLGFRLLNLELGIHFLDLRGLLFYCCRKTSNRVFQFRDSRSEERRVGKEFRFLWGR